MRNGNIFLPTKFNDNFVSIHFFWVFSWWSLYLKCCFQQLHFDSVAQVDFGSAPWVCKKMARITSNDAYVFELSRMVRKAYEINISMLQKCKPYLPVEICFHIRSFLLYHRWLSLFANVFARDSSLDPDIYLMRTLVANFRWQIFVTTKQDGRTITVNLSPKYLTNLGDLTTFSCPQPCSAAMVDWREVLAGVIRKKFYKAFFTKRL